MLNEIQSKTKEDLMQFFDAIGIKYTRLNVNINYSVKPKEILPNSEKIEIFRKFCFFGCDGTSASLSDEEIHSPIYLGASIVAWGIDKNITKTKEYTQRFLIERPEILSNSSLRTILEFRSIVCLLIIRKNRNMPCMDCPFKDSGCQWLKQDNFKPWEEFPDKIGVGICDLPVDFSFISSITTLDKANRDYLIENLKNCFLLIKKHNLPVLFVSHKSEYKQVGKVISDELDKYINTLDPNMKTIILEIEKLIKNRKIELDDLKQISMQIKKEEYNDLKLLSAFIKSLATPTPSFFIKPHDSNGNWDQIKFHYFTWGYIESSFGTEGYVPSTWVRVGYSPALTPEEAHLIMISEMVLGKGHSISLTLAHTSCNKQKEYQIHALIYYLNKNREDINKIGYNIKTINKWRLYK